MCGPWMPLGVFLGSSGPSQSQLDGPTGSMPRRAPPPALPRGPRKQYIANGSERNCVDVQFRL